MKIYTATSVLALILASAIAFADAPLPDTQQLKQRALASFKQSEEDLEKYSCMVHGQTDELNGDGSIKKHETREAERFYVNGIDISHVLVRNGKPLTGIDAKKEQDRVNYEAKRFSDPKTASKTLSKQESQMDMFLRALRFTNGHRETRDGRSTVVYDLLGDPNYHAKTLEEKFAVALTGRIWIDEQTGNPVEIRVQTDKDVKIGGGLIASVHKGFRVHVVQQLQPDGVWLRKSLEWSGDIREAIFLHPRYRFSEEMDKCHLFAVDMQETHQGPKTDAHEQK